MLPEGSIYEMTRLTFGLESFLFGSGPAEEGTLATSPNICSADSNCTLSPKLWQAKISADFAKCLFKIKLFSAESHCTALMPILAVPTWLFPPLKRGCAYSEATEIGTLDRQRRADGRRDRNDFTCIFIFGFFFPSSLLLLKTFNLGIGYILNTCEAGWGNKVDANLRPAWAITVSFRPTWPS